jgi:hypothetical protein
MTPAAEHAAFFKLSGPLIGPYNHRQIYFGFNPKASPLPTAIGPQVSGEWHPRSARSPPPPNTICALPRHCHVRPLLPRGIGSPPSSWKPLCPRRILSLRPVSRLRDKAACCLVNPPHPSPPHCYRSPRWPSTGRRSLPSARMATTPPPR